jgi:multiple sugar transport system permease protein
VLPNFILMKQLGWVYTWKGLLAPYLLMQPFALFFLRQFFLNIPTEIEDAAKIDGLGPWGLYRRICLPLSKAPIATLLTIQAVFAWNEYLWPQLITYGEHAQVLTAALGFFVRSSPTVARDWTGFMAATTVSVVPLVIFMLIFGRRLVTNLEFSGSGK